MNKVSSNIFWKRSKTDSQEVIFETGVSQVCFQLKRGSQFAIDMHLDLQHKIHRFRVQEAIDKPERQESPQDLKRKRCEDCTCPINKSKLTKHSCNLGKNP